MAIKKGYVNGSDVLLNIDGKAVAKCTSHKINHSTETKDRKVKAPAAAAMENGLWGEKGVTGLGVTLDAEGLTYYGETDAGYKALRKAWKTGQPVECVGYEREDSENSDMKGMFVITSLDATYPAQDDVPFSVSLENAGRIYFDEEIAEYDASKTPTEGGDGV